MPASKKTTVKATSGASSIPATSTAGGVKGAYGTSVMESLIAEAKKDLSYDVVDKAELAKRKDPLSDITVTKFDLDDGFVWFSALFHKPSLFEDIPVRVFTYDDWNEEARDYIPTPNPHWVWNKEALERFALAMYDGDTTLLWGPQGTGKSDFAREWCATCLIPFWRLSCNRETREGHFLGSPGVEYDKAGKMHIKQEPTVLTESLKYGGLFCEDEAFRHSAALVLQSLREKSTRNIILPDAPGRSASDRRLVAPKGKWWYVLTDNTCGIGDETGTFDAQIQDASTLDRINMVIEMSYLNPADEKKLLSNYSKLNPQLIQAMVDTAKLVRTAFVNQKIMSTMSVRTLLAWAEKSERIGDASKALRMVWFEKLSRDDQAVVKDIFHQVFARAI